MLTQHKKHTPWLLMPFKWLWDLLALILGLTGRIAGTVIGLVLMIIGLLLTVLIISAPIGIPLMVVGFLLAIRSIF
jgi:hypothetical protein